MGHRGVPARGPEIVRGKAAEGYRASLTSTEDASGAPVEDIGKGTTVSAPHPRQK